MIKLCQLPEEPDAKRHYLGVKLFVSAVVSMAVTFPELVGLALLANLLWIWVDP